MKEKRRMTGGYEVSLLNEDFAKVGGIAKAFATPEAAFWPADWKAA
jgi:hypothetical protein